MGPKCQKRVFKNVCINLDVINTPHGHCAYALRGFVVTSNFRLSKSRSKNFMKNLEPEYRVLYTDLTALFRNRQNKYFIKPCK